MLNLLPKLCRVALRPRWLLLLALIAWTPTQAQEDRFWHELRGGFAMDPALQQPLVQKEIAYLSKNPAMWRQRAERLARYLPYIYGQIHQLGLPAEVALIPLVESGMDAYAFSPGGAAGLWQFIPITGERFGLERNWWYDGRRDVIAATDAALAYFSFLHQSFGDWPLAMAGYNAGEGTVRRALHKHQRKSNDATITTAASNSSKYWSLQLPAETRRYVPRVLAYAALLREPNKYGITLPPMPVESRLQVVDIPGQFDLMKVASVLQVETRDLYRWNPALNQWATPPKGPHRLLVPNSMEQAETALAAIPAEERVNWIRHEVKRGQTLGGIAKRYSTDVATIKRANHLRNHHIQAGKALLVPKSSQALTDYPISRLSESTVHKVLPGESLWTIARQYKVKVKDLVRWNEIAPRDVLSTGRMLRVSRSSRHVVRKVRYAVRRGDSLGHIASRFNVPIRDIVSWNELDQGAYLQPGQALTLYVNVTAGK